MGWKIDRDYINDGDDSRVGYGEEHSRIPVAAAVIGIQSEDLPVKGNGNDLPTVRFRLLDDDGEVYYGGWLHDDDDCANQMAALSFGTSDAGAVTVQVSRNGEWVTEIG